MKKLRDLWEDFPFQLLAAVTALVFLIYSARYSYRFALAGLGLLAFIAFSALLRVRIIRRKRQRLLAALAETLDFSQKESLQAFPQPILICDANGKIVLYNDMFLQDVAGGALLEQQISNPFTGGVPYQQLPEMGVVHTKIGDKYFDLYASVLNYKDRIHYVIYYTDSTRYREMEAEFHASRANVVLIDVDDINQMGLGYRDSEYAEIRNGIEALLEIWAEDYPCMLRRLNDDRFIILAQQRDINQMVLRKFDILDQVRAYAYRDEVLGITLAIGVGSGDTFAESESAAHKALDMALGRGGDQAAVKTENSYEFFGGVSKSSEKRTQAKTRLVAASLVELISGSDQVLVMGHNYPDLDAMGAAVGLVAAARSQKTAGYIVVDPARSLARPLLDRLEEENEDSVIVSEQEALQLLHNGKSLLIVVDTHIESFLEFPQVYQQADTVIVIDHHRKMVNFIEDALIFHHDPNASSTCEMVTELLQYITPKLKRFEAEALLAGIMLDTKNFVLRTRVRTFDAAAYLRGKGADTVKVKKLFATSMEINKNRNIVVANAEIFRGCAISVVSIPVADIRIICAQAADELLNVEGVRASFVIYRDQENTAHVSARSYGEYNVQLIMEKMGGGGHQTMAAAQFPGVAPEVVKLQLEEVLKR